MKSPPPPPRAILFLSRASTSSCHASLKTSQVFVETRKRDPSHLNTLLANHVRTHNYGSTLHLFHQMHGEGCVRLDGYTFTPVLKACPSLLDGGLLGRQVHGLMIKTGSLSGPVSGTSLLDMYSKCGHLGDAISVFDEDTAGPKDVVAWNCLLSCFVRHALPAHALGAFRSMLGGGIEFTGFTLCTLLKACASLNALQLGKQIHASLVVTCRDDSLVLGTALIDFYSECGLVQDAIRVFKCFSDCREDDDEAICNALLRGFVRNRRLDEAFSMLGKMRPNGVGLTCALSACSSESTNLSRGREMHSVIIRRGLFDHDTILGNALLDMYSKCGKIGSARSVFDQIGRKNVITWTAIIDAYGTHGQGGEALRLFKKMEEGKLGPFILPNSATYLSVLSACAHSGLIEEGLNCFVSMRERRGLTPGPEHYSCIIDMLGRAGQIEEAWDIFLGMSRSCIKSSGRPVCASMLNACRMANDVVKGERVAKLLLELEPDNPGIYVLLSNFYATGERWQGVEELRRVTKDRGLRKEAGSSWITAEGSPMEY